MRLANSFLVKILLDLASCVRSLHIRQQSYRLMNNAETIYFFGMNNTEWGPVIVEMFSRKLEKLQIENQHYPGFLTNRSCEVLKEVCNKVKSEKGRVF